MKKIEIFNEVKSFKVPRKRLLNAFGAFFEAEGVKSMEVGLIFVGEAKMAKLNEKWKKRKGPTDVLSFNYGKGTERNNEGEGDCDCVTGEIYICVKVAERYALEVGESLSSEILNLFMHGLLHLAGYTHENDQKLEKMMDRAKKIFSRL